MKIAYKVVPIELVKELKENLLGLALEIQDVELATRTLSVEDMANSLGIEICCRTAGITFDEFENLCSDEAWCKEYLRWDDIQEEAHKLITEITNNLKVKRVLQ